MGKFVIKQCSLVLVYGHQYAGLAESNNSRQLGLFLMSTASWLSRDRD